LGAYFTGLNDIHHTIVIVFKSLQQESIIMPMTLTQFSEKIAKELFIQHTKAYVKSSVWHQRILEKLVSCLLESNDKVEVISGVDEIFKRYAHIPYKTYMPNKFDGIYWHHIEQRRRYLRDELLYIIGINDFSNKGHINELDRLRLYAECLPDIASKIKNLGSDHEEDGTTEPQNVSGLLGYAAVARTEIDFFQSGYKSDFLTSLSDFSKRSKATNNIPAKREKGESPDFCAMLIRASNESVDFKSHIVTQPI